jgi:hypothetical protein
MIKFQKKFQKIIVFAALLACVAMFIYGLGIASSPYETLFGFYDYQLPEDDITQFADAIIYVNEIEPYAAQFIQISIIMLLVSLTLFFTNTHVRRKYYIGNFIATAVTAAGIVAFAVWAIINNTAIYEMYRSIDFVAMKEHGDYWFIPYVEPDFTWFKVFYGVISVFLLTAVGLVLNLVLKLRVMKQEDALLAQGASVAV